MGGNLVAMARIEEVLKENLRDIQFSPHDWPSIRGNSSNSAQANGSQPLLDRTVWERSILCTAAPTLSEKEEGTKTGPRPRLNRPSSSTPRKRRSCPGFFPIATNKLAIYRTYADVRAVHLESGTDSKGEPYAAGDVAFRMGSGLGIGLDGSLFAVLDDPNTDQAIETVPRSKFQQFSRPTLLPLQQFAAGDHLRRSRHGLCHRRSGRADPSPHGGHIHVADLEVAGGAELAACLQH